MYFKALPKKMDGMRGKELASSLQMDDDHETPEYLERINNDFKYTVDLKKKLEIVCYYEGARTEVEVSKNIPENHHCIYVLIRMQHPDDLNKKKRILVVTEKSATIPGTNPPLQLAGDHRSMIKFDHPKDPDYQSVARSIGRILKQGGYYLEPAGSALVTL